MSTEQREPQRVSELLATIERSHRRLIWLPAVIVLFTGICLLLDFLITRPRAIPAEAYGVVDQGQPIAAAIYQFKQDSGHWPVGLDDLVPQYVDRIPPGWIYDAWDNDAGWRLWNTTGERVWIDSHSPIWAVGMGRGMRLIEGWPVLRPVTAVAPSTSSAPANSGAIRQHDEGQ